MIKTNEMTQDLTFDEKYAAIGKEGKAFEGVFITAVTSTGIFCRPSCRARKPKPENIIFYEQPLEAIRNGFRPCKICKPMEREGETPQVIQNIIRELQADPYLRIKDQDLRERGIEPSQIRRWFKKHYKMTFHAYQRMLRINKAYNQIKGGNSVTNTAFGLGYESLSGFSDGVKSVFGSSPKEIEHKRVINIMRFTTAIGPMFACATEAGLCLLEFTDRRMLETEFQDLCHRLDAVILPGTNKHLDQIQIELDEYFNGTRQTFDVTLEPIGTDFQKDVWNVLMEIPYGETWSYKDEAIKLGKLKAIRAVASANGYNKIAIVIPCHRVIGSDGSLTGYGGGLERKAGLLALERKYSGQAVQGELDLQ